MILIVGGTGSLGSAATRRLPAKGTAVRLMTHSPEKVAELQKLGAEIVPGALFMGNDRNFGFVCVGKPDLFGFIYQPGK